MLVWACVLWAAPAWGQNQVAIASFQTERNEDVYQMSAQFDLELSNTVQEALLKGIPVYFVVDTKVYRDRWYWSDIGKIVPAHLHLSTAIGCILRVLSRIVSPSVGASAEGIINLGDLKLCSRLIFFVGSVMISFNGEIPVF